MISYYFIGNLCDYLPKFININYLTNCTNILGGEVYAVVNSKGLIMFGAYGMYDIKETLSTDDTKLFGIIVEKNNPTITHILENNEKINSLTIK